MIGLARGLGLKVTAEGVETEEEAKALRELGCDHLQGFHFGRPVRPEVPRSGVLKQSAIGTDAQPILPSRRANGRR
jgi:EAL domain-containing protein (putative c-di-GMP-specific phosphodiesterase class I)